MSNTVLFFLVTLLSITIAGAQSPEVQRRAAHKAKMERFFEIEQRVDATRPTRREGPVRGDNISEEEIQEIKSLMVQIHPGAIVNIGTIVTGCPCEDGANCTGQVWIVTQRFGKSSGLLFSRINNHWLIGPVQQWWLDREALETRRDSFGSDRYFKAVDALMERFPTCIKPG